MVALGASIIAMIVDAVPPDMRPLNLNAVADFPTEMWAFWSTILSVLWPRYARISLGILSNPHAGTIIEPVFVA